MSEFVCITVEDSKKDSFACAIADVVCWMDGFQAGGGTYSPGSLGALRDLRGVIDRAYATIPPQGNPALRRLTMMIIDIVRSHTPKEIHAKHAAQMFNEICALLEKASKQ